MSMISSKLWRYLPTPDLRRMKLTALISFIPVCSAEYSDRNIGCHGSFRFSPPSVKHQKPNIASFRGHTNDIGWYESFSSWWPFDLALWSPQFRLRFIGPGEKLGGGVGASSAESIIFFNRNFPKKWQQMFSITTCNAEAMRFQTRSQWCGPSAQRRHVLEEGILRAGFRYTNLARTNTKWCEPHIRTALSAATTGRACDASIEGMVQRLWGSAYAPRVGASEFVQTSICL